MHMDENFKVGNFICELRKGKGLSQAELGSKLNVIKSITIYNENGDDVTENYNIVPRMGTLTILPDV